MDLLLEKKKARRGWRMPTWASRRTRHELLDPDSFSGPHLSATHPPGVRSGLHMPNKPNLEYVSVDGRGGPC